MSWQLYAGRWEFCRRLKAGNNSKINSAGADDSKSADASASDPAEGATAPAPEAARKELERRRNSAARQKAWYEKLLRELKDKAEPLCPPEPSAPELDQPHEQDFTAPVAIKAPDAQKDLKVNRAELPHPSGYHVGFDYPKRVDLKLVVTDVTYKVETLTNIRTGQFYRAATIEEGPENFGVTWGFIETILKMTVGFCIPINRVSQMIGQKGFSSGKICRILAYIAHQLLPVFIELAEQLAGAKIISGDDTKTKIVDTATPAPRKGKKATKIQAMLATLDACLGFKAPRKDGNGDIKSLNVSLLMGRKDPKDKRSMICLFWSHFGYVGNVLSKILELRSPRAGPLTFQGDLSANNLPDFKLRKLIKVVLSGCGAHARRPFWRYQNDDPDFCFYMLRGFALLAGVEARINRMGRTHDRTLKLRGKYSRLIWLALRNRCLAAVTGNRPTPSTKPYSSPPLITWPKKSKLRNAAEYVIGNFTELTLYLTDPRLEYTNNRRERGLRPEVCTLVASKFRKTRHGRAVLDILRTINATCTAAKLDLSVYLRYVWRNLDDVPTHPELYTPHAVTLALDAANEASPVSLAS